jgi:hypothetical protein
MEILGYITVVVLLAGGGWLLWQNRRWLPARRGVTPERTRGFVGIGLLAHALVIGFSIFPTRGCLHERPLGVPGGSGMTIAQGQVSTNLRQYQQQEQQRQANRRRLTREGLLQILRESDDLNEDEQKAQQRAMDNVGLPQGTVGGSTAAGSPFGTRIGGELWLYRVKHSGDNWDANPRALPVLLQEVKKAFPGLKVSSKQEVITLTDLPRHKGPHFPTFLFFTGTGGVDANDQERRNLREYLHAGGFVVADSSGGNFEQAFKQFIRPIAGRHRLRPIEFDHEVFRGDKVLYQLTHGCPIYRAHGRQDDAEGVFDDSGRLMVFISPGDLGSAWASVAMGQSRTSVERAFQMGTNLVSYTLNTVRDRREEKK